MRGVSEQNRAVPVHRQLAGGTAVRSPARCEHGGVDTVPVGREGSRVGVLEVEHQRLAADPLEIGCLVRVADDADRLMPRFGEQPLQDQGDLAVTSGDDDLH